MQGDEGQKENNNLYQAINSQEAYHLQRFGVGQFRLGRRYCNLQGWECLLLSMQMSG